MGKFKTGFWLGGALGAGLVWLNFTKKGKAMREELLDHAAVVYEQLKEKALASKEWKEMNKNKYVAMVKEVVDQYAIKNGLAEKVKNVLTKVLETQWSNFQNLMSKEK